MILTDYNKIYAAPRKCWRIGPDGMRVNAACSQKKVIDDGAEAVADELQDYSVAYVTNPAGFQMDRSHNMHLLFGALLPVMVAARMNGYNEFADVMGIDKANVHTTRLLHSEAEARAYAAARIMLGTTEERLELFTKQLPVKLSTLKDQWVFSIGRARAAVQYEVVRGFTLAGEAALRAAGGNWQKRWNLGPEHPADDICDDNFEAGPIPLGAEFPSGDLTVPAHPNCTCEISYSQKEY